MSVIRYYKYYWLACIFSCLFSNFYAYLPHLFFLSVILSIFFRFFVVSFLFNRRALLRPKSCAIYCNCFLSPFQRREYPQSSIIFFFVYSFLESFWLLILLGIPLMCPIPSFNYYSVHFIRVFIYLSFTFGSFKSFSYCNLCIATALFNFNSFILRLHRIWLLPQSDLEYVWRLKLQSWISCW